MPLTFRGGNDEPGSPVYRGFYAGQNFTGLNVYVDIDTLFTIIKDDINMHGSVLTDWTDTLTWMEDDPDGIIEAESGDKLYLIPDCLFVAVEPAVAHWTDAK